MKVIFLDFDGVITTPESKWCIDKDKVKLIERIIDATDAKIVISSSWRYGTRSLEEFIKDHFSEDAKYKAFIKYDVAKESPKFIDSIIGMTDKKGSERGEEIQRWLDSHDDIDQYIIIDDDSDMLYSQLIHFIQTDGYEGITEREVKLAIAVLNDSEYVFDARLNYVIRYYRMLKCNGIDSSKYDGLKKYYDK